MRKKRTLVVHEALVWKQGQAPIIDQRVVVSEFIHEVSISSSGVGRGRGMAEGERWEESGDMGAGDRHAGEGKRSS